MPDHLVFTIKNWRSWILEVGRHYEIIIQVYSSNRMQIYPSDNLVIDAYFEPTKLPVHFQSTNGSFNYLHGKEKGITLAKASLKGTRNLINNNLVVFDWVVRGEQEIELLDPIEVNKIINNRSIYLPNLNNMKRLIYFKLMFIGYSKSFDICIDIINIDNSNVE
jgi:hypothetical protein